MPNTLPFQFKRLNPSPYAAQQAAIEEFLAQQRPDTAQPEMSQVNLSIPSRVDTSNLSPPPLVDTASGRPRIMPKLLPKLNTDQQLDAERQLRGELETFEPQKAHGLRRLAPLPEGLARGAKYGPWGTVGGGAVAALMALLNPKYADEKWKEKRLAQTGETIHGLEGEQSQGIENQIRQAQLNEIQNPAKKPRPTSYRVLTQDEGNLKKGTKVGREFDDKTGQWVDTGTVLDLPDEAKSPGISSLTRTVREGEYEGVPAGSEIRLASDGSDFVRDGKPIIAKISLVEKPVESPKDKAERRRHYIAARTLFNDLIEQENSAAKAKDEARKEYEKVRQAWKDKGEKNVDIQSDVVAAKKAFDDAQARYASFWGKKNEAKATMAQYGDTDDKGEPTEPLDPSPQTTGKPNLTIEGAIEHFKEKKKRAPTPAEIAKMQAALQK